MPRSLISILLVIPLSLPLLPMWAEAQPEATPPTPPKAAPKPEAMASARPWVKVTYIIDTGEKKESHYLVGQVDPLLLRKVDAGEGVAFIRLDKACWYGFDDEGNPGSVIPYAKDNASGPVYIATHTIESIDVQALDPDAYIKSIEDKVAKPGN